MSGTGSVSSITDSALSLVQNGTTPSVASGTSVPTAGTPGVSSGSVDPGTSYDTSPVGGTSPTDAQYADAAKAQAAASAGSTATPAQWNDAVRTEFTKLGLTPNQVAQVEALNLSQADVEQVYTRIAADPTLKAQIPDQPVGTTSTDAGQAAGGTAPADGTKQAAAVQGGGGIGQGTPTGPPAWNDDWRKKFVDAGAPAELIQQLTFTGAMGADATQLESSLKQLNDTINKELVTFRAKFPKAYEKLAKSSTVDRATLYQVAAAADAGQISQDQFTQIVDSANASMGNMVKDMFLKQFLPWTIIPGWGAIRMGISIFNGGKDPISGDKIYLDFWNHGLTGWMDAAMAVGGAMTLASGIRGAMTVSKGLSFASKATGEVGVVAAREGLQNLSLSGKMKAFLPFTETNKLATGFARLEGLDKNIKLMTEGSVARVAAESLYSQILSSSTVLKSNAGIKIGLGGVFTDGRGMFMNRHAPLIEHLTENGQSVIKLESRVQGREFAALFAGAGVDALSAADRTKLIAQFGGELGGAQNLAGLRNLAISEAGTALNLAAPTNPLSRLLGIVKPGPLQDVLKVMSGAQPSKLAVAFQNPMVKYGVLGGVGIAAVGASAIFKINPLAMIMGGQTAPAADAQQGAGQTQGQAQDQGQLTADQQAAVQQFVAMPPANQQAFLEQGVAQLNMLTALAKGGAVPAGLSADDTALVKQFMAQPAADQANTIAQYQGELELLATAAKQAVANGTSGSASANTGGTQLKNGVPVSGDSGQQQASGAAPQDAAPAPAPAPTPTPTPTPAGAATAPLSDVSS